MAKININYQWCKSCGICADLCPVDVLEINTKRELTIINEEKCIKCMLCELRCPDVAIEIEEDQNEDI